MNVGVLMPGSLHMSGTEIPDSTRLSASMIWLSVNRDFFISVDPLRWKKFYFSALWIFGGITGLLESIEDEVSAHGLADAPAHDASSINIDDERHIQPTLPSRNIGEVRHPELVRAVGLELALHMIQRAGRIGIGNRRSHLLAPNRALQAHTAHQTFNGATGYAGAFAVHLHPDLICAIDLHVGVPHAFDMRHQLSIALRTGADT